MSTLYLPIKKHWFDMISSGEKKEEYREITPYWISRLLWHGFSKCTPSQVLFLYNYSNSDILKKRCFLSYCNAIFKRDIEVVVLRNGYGENVPQEQFIPGCIMIGLPKKEWCPPDTDLEKPVFIIPVKHLLPKFFLLL